MERVEKFLKEAGTYYLATVDKDQPRVRPFGTIHNFEGKLYILKIPTIDSHSHAFDDCIKKAVDNSYEVQMADFDILISNIMFRTRGSFIIFFNLDYFF